MTDLDSEFLQTYFETEGERDPIVEDLIRRWNQWKKSVRQSLNKCTFIPNLSFSDSEIEYLNSKLLDQLKQMLTNRNIILDDAFRVACGCGYLETAQWILKTYPHLDHRAGSSLFHRVGDERAFYDACVGGHLKVVKWLMEIFLDIDPFNNLRNYICSFGRACVHGHLDVAQWVYHQKKELAKNYRGYFRFDLWHIFELVCGDGHLGVAQWMYSTFITLPYDPLDPDSPQFAFTNACRNGHISVAEWLRSTFTILPEFRCYGKPVFVQTAGWGQLDVIKWLISAFPNTNFRDQVNDAFWEASKEGHLLIAQWLYQQFYSYIQPTDCTEKDISPEVLDWLSQLKFYRGDDPTSNVSKANSYQ